MVEWIWLSLSSWLSVLTLTLKVVEWCKPKMQPATRNFHRKSLFTSIGQKERLPQNRDSLSSYNQVLKISLPT